MTGGMVMIQTRFQASDTQGHQIHFAGVPRAARRAGFMEQLPKHRGMQIAGDAPDQREKVGYIFQSHLPFREFSMCFSRQQNSDELGIGKSASWKQFLSPSQSIEDFRL